MKDPTVTVEEIPVTPPVETRSGRVDEFEFAFLPVDKRGEVGFSIV